MLSVDRRCIGLEDDAGLNWLMVASEEQVLPLYCSEEAEIEDGVWPGGLEAVLGAFLGCVLGDEVAEGVFDGLGEQPDVGEHVFVQEMVQCSVLATRRHSRNRLPALSTRPSWRCG